LSTKTGKLGLLQTDKNCKSFYPYLLYRQLIKLSNENCLDETTIYVDTILYLSLYCLVNDLVHLPNLYITNMDHSLPGMVWFSLLPQALQA